MALKVVIEIEHGDKPVLIADWLILYFT